MDEAGDDSITPTPGGSPKAVAPEVSRAPPPTRPIVGRAGIPSRPRVVGFVPVAPPGFAAFAIIPELLASHAEAWGVPAARRPPVGDLAAHALPIAHALAANEAHAAAIIPHNGDVVWAPAGTWRASGFVGREEQSTAVFAMMGQRIPVEGANFYPRSDCYPILPRRTLALIFGAENPPEPPPQSALDQIRDIETRPARPRGELPVQRVAEASAKHKLVPDGILLRWWKDTYLPHHPDPDKRPDVETQRKDAAAAFPNHVPPGEQMMKRLRRDQATPAEWREQGRRPKSSR